MKELVADTQQLKNKVYYTALKICNPQTEGEFNWGKYIEWSKLTHLQELVSLDGILNEPVFEPDLNSKYDWNYVVTDGEIITLFFSSIDYVLEKVKALKHFNLLAVIKEPKKEKAKLEPDFEFVGYELIDKGGEVSALTNCGGFDEIFSPSDLNEFGLVSDYDKAKKIQTELAVDNPTEHHADCYLYEVWRHKIIGRIIPSEL